MTQKILITGASGLLGYNACRFFHDRGYDVTGLSHTHAIGVDGVVDLKVDITDPKAMEHVVQSTKPDLVLHCAALANVDVCEEEPDKAYLYNVSVPEQIAKLCRDRDAKLIYITTDQLWDGTATMMKETDSVSPLNVYAKTKAESEGKVMAANPDALVLRTNFFGRGPSWRLSFSCWVDQELSAGREINGFDDIYYTPIAIPDLLVAIEALYKKHALGIVHLAGSEKISKYQFAIQYAELAGLDQSLIKKTTSEAGKLRAKRPADMSLDVSKAESLLGYQLPTIEQSIKNILDDSNESKRKVS